MCPPSPKKEKKKKSQKRKNENQREKNTSLFSLISLLCIKTMNLSEFILYQFFQESLDLFVQDSELV